VKSGEDVASVFGRELLAIVEDEIERGGMTLHEHVGRQNFVG
jgi:hypothetical protein